MYACGEKVTENMDKQEKIEEIKQGIAPFAPSDSNCLNFKLPVESNPQAQPLEDVFL